MRFVQKKKTNEVDDFAKGFVASLCWVIWKDRWSSLFQNTKVYPSKTQKYDVNEN